MSTTSLPDRACAGFLQRVAALLAFVSALAVGLRVGIHVGARSDRIASGALLVLAALLFGAHVRGRRALIPGAVAVLTLALSAPIDGIEGNAVFVVGGTATLALALGRDERLGSILVAGAALFACRTVGLLVWDPLWRFEQALSAGYAWIAETATGIPVRWGPSASGVGLVMLGLALLVSAWTHGVGSHGALGARRGLVSLGALLVLPIALLVTALEVFERTAVQNGSIESARLFAFQLAFLPWVAAALAPTVARDHVEGSTSSARIPVLAAALGCIPFALPGEAPRERADAPGLGRVLIHASAPGLSDFNTADWSRLGFGRSGMYGELLRWLEASGREPTVIERRLDVSDLEGVGTLVLLVPTEPYGEAELDAIGEFVEGGGGLLFLTDHTDLMGSAGVGNAVLERYGIEIRFDTVMETAASFAGNLQYRHVGVLDAPRESHATQILHGASLRLSGGARPVIVAQSAFGDFGNRDNGGNGAFLGDYRAFPAVEQVGDLVIAASARDGAGRVLVFGDTSSFQNIAISRSLGFVAGVFGWLEGDSPRTDPRWCLAALLASVVLALGIVPSRARGAAPWLSAGVLAGSLAAWSPAPDAADNARACAELPEGRSVFLVHGADLPLWPKRQFDDRSIQGLATCAARAGLVPLFGDAGAADLSRCSFVVVPPAGRLDAKSSERLAEFAEDGGTLVVAAGFEERRGIEPLIARFGLAIDGVPLGAAPILHYDQQMQHVGPQFAEAWPVIATSGAIEPSEVRYAVDGCAIVVERAVGEGKLIVIGDSWFLCDKHLEGETNFLENNVGFVRDLLFERGWAAESAR